MFEPSIYDTPYDTSTSYGRFLERYELGARFRIPFWRTRLTFWWFVHNVPSHILIGILPIKPFFAFHDWTSLNMRPWDHDEWSDPEDTDR